MMLYVIPLVFAALLEYQAFASPGTYSMITGLGLCGLMVFHMLEKTGKPKVTAATRNKSHQIHKIKRVETMAAGIYGAAIAATLVFGAGVGIQLSLIMMVAMVGVGVATFREGKADALLQKAGRVVRHHLAPSVSFHIPVFLLYLFTFLLSVQLSSSTAFQSILILSTIILHDLLRKNCKWAFEMENKEISEEELQHLLFHRWVKYWNFFLGVWWLFSLHENRTLSDTQYAFLLFTFVVVYVSVLLRNLNVFKLKDMGLVIIASGLLVGLDSIFQGALNRGLPLYFQAALMVIVFDLGDGYFHHRNFHEAGRAFWTQKTALYFLSTLYIVQIHLMMSNPVFSVQDMYHSLFYKQNAGEIYSSVLHAEAPGKITDSKLPVVTARQPKVVPPNSN